MKQSHSVASSGSSSLTVRIRWTLSGIALGLVATGLATWWDFPNPQHPQDPPGLSPPTAGATVAALGKPPSSDRATPFANQTGARAQDLNSPSYSQGQAADTQLPGDSLPTQQTTGRNSLVDRDTPAAEEIFEYPEGANLPAKDEREEADDEDSVGEIEALHDDFELQSRDPQWTAQMHQYLQGARMLLGRDSSSAGVTQDLIDCKQTVCKLVLGFADKEALETYVDNVTVSLKGMPGIGLHIAEHEDGGGHQRADAYFTRRTNAGVVP